MPRFPISWPGWTKRANAALDSLLYRISVYGVPAAIAGISLIALFTFDKQYAAGAGSPLELRVFDQTGEEPAPAQALARL